MGDYETKCIQIDELRICYSADTDKLNELMSIEADSFMDIFGYRFCRTISSRFRYYFEIWKDDEHIAQLKFGLYTDFSSPKQFVYFKINNQVLYKSDLFRKTLKLPDEFGFVFNNYTSLDLAIDSSINYPSLIKHMMRNKEITTIINGKAIKDRKQVIQGLSFQYSSSLDRLKHTSITIKQKKAISNKRDGITIQAYDKKAEIEQTSNKQFIMEFYGHPRRLYRLEVRLHYQELKDYFGKVKELPIYEALSDQHLLQDMFYYHLSSVIRFTRKRKKLDWKTIINCNGKV